MSWGFGLLVAGSALTLFATGCSLIESLDPPERREAQWAIDPRADIGPGSERIPLFVGEVACASGRDATGRISIEVDYQDEIIVVAAYVRPLGGDQTCPSNPPTPYVLDLDEPLGDRGLVNGATTETAQRPLDLPGRAADDPVHPPDRVQAEDDVPAHVRFLAGALHARAVDTGELGDLGDLALHPDGVALLLGPRTIKTADPADLGNPAAWEMTGDYAGAVGPFSALDTLGRSEAITVSLGPQPHCAGPPRPAPEGYQGLQRVALEPIENDSCLQWFVVNLYLDGGGRVRAIQLDLWEP